MTVVEIQSKLMLLAQLPQLYVYLPGSNIETTFEKPKEIN